MRNTLAPLTLLLCALLFCGCHAEQAPDPAIDTYINMAQAFIDAGDYDAAVKTLEQGIATTNADTLKDMLADLRDEQTADTTQSADTSAPEDDVIEDTEEETGADTSYPEDYSSENYYYNTENSTYEDNKVLVKPGYVRWEDGLLVAECFIINGYPYSVTNIDIQSFSLSTETRLIAEGSFGVLEGETLEPYTYAVWTLTFTSGIYSPGALLYNGLEWSSTVSCDEAAPTYDMTKASGILASMGMTEQEFKDSCTYIGSRFHASNEYVYKAGFRYYYDHPEDTKPQSYAKYWKDYQANGKASQHYTVERAYYFDKSDTLDDFLNIAVYGPKGASILGAISEETFAGMKEYPDNYTGSAYLLKDFIPDTTYNYIYEIDVLVNPSTPIRVYDYRDNVNAPTVSSRTEYDMYVIFLGNYISYDSKIGLEFALIALEKCP